MNHILPCFGTIYFLTVPIFEEEKFTPYQTGFSLIINILPRPFHRIS